MTVIEEAIPALSQAVENEAGRVAEMQALAAGLRTVLPSEASEMVEVTNVEVDEFSISFDVDQVGQPVLVRTSYFPNWEVSGAEGPFRVSPNQMVVIPTDTSVELSYGRSGIEVVSLGLTALGLLALVGLSRLTLPAGGRLWDLGASPLDLLPSRDLVANEVQDGRARPESIQRLVEETGGHLRRSTAGAVASLGLVAATLALHLLVGPTTEEPILSLMVWVPGTAGLLAFVFGHLPDLVDVVRYRSTVVEPARAFASYAGRPMAPASDRSTDDDGTDLV